ncbi:MAG: glycosyltransferase family 9 protein [Candidatus Omnitrophica bacterium]|nr:glycosyltransferase family 9 protein [Candidatus Omnitrophota bacterium]MCM8777332.1 glycosyltransferase family 9 protein [Candidatus Omnitrophota bacterium]
MKEKLKQFCRFFKADAPCIYHKLDGRKCSECMDFRGIIGNILIIKKDAAGDVLRTTALLQPLKRKFPEHKIIWLVAEKNKDVLEGNPYIDEIWTDKPEIINAISFFHFDVVINLDLSLDSLITAGIANTKQFYGFRYQKNRKIQCSNKPAEEWFLMSHNDDMKKKNRKTYQQFIAEITELNSYGEIIVPLKELSIAKAEKFSEKHHLSGKKVIGINTGSGSRWRTKKWPEENITRIIKMLTDKRYTVLLFGGKEEKATMENLKDASNPYLINTGYNNTIPNFFALLNLCNVVISVDTLAMHTATGLKKKVIALFGPTSPYEIEGYGRIEKITTPLDCFCCYKRECNITPNCMEMINPETVVSGIEKIL